ncbi:RNA polymerase factor sigma-54 [Candidatus Riflebacteria bacterium]
MKMMLGLSQKLSLQQKLIMTPRMQQSIKMLLLNQLELASMIKEEVLTNPLIEVSEPVSKEATETISHNLVNDNQTTTANETPEEFQKEYSVDWQKYLEEEDTRGNMARTPNYGQDDEVNYEKFTSSERDLMDHLREQLRLSVSNPLDLQIGEFIIESINAEGYLTMDLSEIAEHLKTDREDVESILEVVQAFDPAGVGARSYPESLILQARADGNTDPIFVKVLTEHFEDLAYKNYREIASALKCEIEEILEISDAIKDYVPYPGLKYATSQGTIYIKPDIIIDYDENSDLFNITVNERDTPVIKINRQYKRIMLQSAGNPETQKYLKGKFDSAQWLIKSIKERKKTIEKVAHSIVKHQSDFLKSPDGELKPLILKDIAEEIEMNESTVSRVTTNKYAQTPRGLLELKVFFTGGKRSANGENISTDQIKKLIKELVSREDIKKPLSDQKIANQIWEKLQIKLARRTVSKYREEMGILSSSKRKAF